MRTMFIISLLGGALSLSAPALAQVDTTNCAYCPPPPPPCPPLCPPPPPPPIDSAQAVESANFTSGSLTVTSWGAWYSASQRKAHLFDGSVTQVQTGCVEIDESLLEILDVDGATHGCEIGTITYVTLHAHLTDAYPEAPSGSWADYFWNVEKYPGKRALKKDEAQATLDFVLIADGITTTDEIYDVLGANGGIDRAFAKLDEIKDHLIYWETGAHAPQLLSDNAVRDDGQPFERVWDGFDYGPILKDHPAALERAYESPIKASFERDVGARSVEVPWPAALPGGGFGFDDSPRWFGDWGSERAGRPWNPFPSPRPIG